VIKETRAAWVLGALSGWFAAGCVVTRSWSLIPFVIVGLYGLVDTDRLNVRLNRARTTEFQVGRDFSRFPAGRFKAEHGGHSGEALREVLIERLKSEPLIVNLDGTMGYSSAFLDEAFRGLWIDTDLRRLTLKSEDPSLVLEVEQLLQSPLRPT